MAGVTVNVLAIGATGFLGSRVVRRLVRQGHRVAVFHRGMTEAKFPESVRHIFGDRNELPGMIAELKRFAPDVVLDVIPYTERQARQTAEVFSGRAARLVAISSGDVYRNYDGLRGKGKHPPDPVPLSEESPLREHFYPYRGSDAINWFTDRDEYEKILVERVVLEHRNLAGTVMRLPAMYGPGDSYHRFFGYLKRMEDKRPFILLGKEQARWRWTHGYVENVALAVVLAVTDQRAAGRIYNVGERKAPTESERVLRLARATGWKGEVIAFPEARLPEHLKVGFDWRYQLVTDTRRIRDELGYEEPVAELEALSQTLQWERSHPPVSLAPEQFDYGAEDRALNRPI